MQTKQNLPKHSRQCLKQYGGQNVLVRFLLFSDWLIQVRSLSLTRGLFFPSSPSARPSAHIQRCIQHSIRSKMAAKTLCVFYFCLLLFISTVVGQLPKKEKYYAIKEDLPYIRCETCQKAVKYLYGKTQEMRQGAAAKKVSLVSLDLTRFFVVDAVFSYSMQKNRDGVENILLLEK